MLTIQTTFNTFCLLVITLLVSACAYTPANKGNDPILEALTNIDGEFVWNKKLARHIYNEMEAIENAISRKNPDKVVTVLVNCIDDSSPSNSTLNGKHVSLGLVCYQALSQTAYYEPTGNIGDIKKTWPGHILPTASAHEFQEAKRAWLNVINTKSYILY